MEFDDLLEGLSGDDRAARLTLLRRLAAQGVPRAELSAAVHEDRLALLPVDRLLGGRWTAAEIEAQHGLPSVLLTRNRRLLGLPEPAAGDRVFSDEDIEAARAVKLFLDAGLTQEAITEIGRVLGESMARLAAVTAANFVDTFLSAGLTELEVAERFVAVASELRPATAPVLVAAYNAHLREAAMRGVIGRSQREAGGLSGSAMVAVCFADLVGFTRLGSQVDPEELGMVARTLASLAAEVAEPPVRLVKTIGDAAMLACPEPAPLIEAGLALVEAVEDEDLPALRAGLAFGPATARAGDYYGHSVNLASRVTGVARPGTVLCSVEMRDAAPEAFEWSFTGRHRVKGIAEPVELYRARRLGSHAAEAETQSDARDRRRRERRSRRNRPETL
jgi:adenylate cyclase